MRSNENLFNVFIDEYIDFTLKKEKPKLVKTPIQNTRYLQPK